LPGLSFSSVKKIAPHLLRISTEGKDNPGKPAGGDSHTRF
jgi:hypothetical protein